MTKENKVFALLAWIYRPLINLYWMTINFLPLFREWLKDHKERSCYASLTEDELRAARTSDTVFICGTGYSVLSIGVDEWSRIGQHDVLSFRCFPKQRFVKADFHMTGEIDDVDEYAKDINHNPLYNNTIFIVQQGIQARMGNRLIGERLLRSSARIFRFRRIFRGVVAPLSKHFSEGVVHGYGSICSAINLAYLIGWKRIVLVGIDLYDHRHFYHPPDQLRGVEKQKVILNDPYVTSKGIVKLVGLWGEELKHEGREIYVYNPKSLLSRCIPVFKWPSDVIKTNLGALG